MSKLTSCYRPRNSADYQSSLPFCLCNNPIFQCSAHTGSSHLISFSKYRLISEHSIKKPRFQKFKTCREMSFLRTKGNRHNTIYLNFHYIYSHFVSSKTKFFLLGKQTPWLSFFFPEKGARKPNYNKEIVRYSLLL
jgi:hypothetical protein